MGAAMHHPKFSYPQVTSPYDVLNLMEQLMMINHEQNHGDVHKFVIEADYGFGKLNKT